MFTKTPSILIFIILTARIACLHQPTVSFSYNAQSATVKLGSRTQSNTFSDNKFLHPPRSVIIYYLDARSVEEATKGGKSLDDSIRKDVWERPADEVRREFAQDEQDEMKYLEAVREWKRNKGRKDADPNLPEPQKQERSPDPAINGSKKLLMTNINDKEEFNLRIKIVELTFEQLVLVVYLAPVFDLLYFTGDVSGELKLSQGNSWSILPDSLAAEYRVAFESQPVVTQSKTGEKVPVTNWVSSSYLTFFFFCSNPAGEDGPYTTYTADGKAYFVQYPRHKIFRLRSANSNKRIGLKFEYFPSMFQAVLDLPRPEKIKTVRLRFQNGNEPHQTIWEADLRQPNAEFDFDRDIPAKYDGVYDSVSSPIYFLSLADNALQVDGTLKNKVKNDRLAIKALDLGASVRLSMYLTRGNLTPEKNTLMVAKPNSRPFKFYWVLPASNVGYQLQFERKLLLELAFMKKTHYVEMMRATRLFDGASLNLCSPTRPPTTPTLDFGWAVNFRNLDVSLARHSSVTHSTSDANHYFMYPRADGFLVNVAADRITLLSFFRIHNEYKEDLTIPVTGFFPGRELQVSVALFDVSNGMQRFDFPAFPVLGKELFFAKLGTSMQDQLVNIKVVVCEATSGSLVLCVFNMRSSFELDVYKNKAVYWRDYQATTIEGLAPNHQVTPVFMVNDKCFLPKFAKFTAFRFNGYEKWFVEAHANPHRDPARATPHCVSADNSCFLFFPSNFDSRPTHERLKDFAVARDGFACTMGVESKVEVFLELPSLNLLFQDKPTQKVSFRFLTPFVWSKKITWLAWGDNMVKLQCKDEKNDVCGYSWVSYAQEKLSLASPLILAREHPLNMPLLLYKVVLPVLQLESRHIPGQITIGLTFKSFEIATQDVSMGFAEFERVKVYQKSPTVSKATLSVFLLGLAPVTVPLVLRRPENFLQLLKDRPLTEFAVKIQGNVDPFFVFTLYNHIAQGRYSLYCVEDDQGVMQVIVYRSSELGAYELIDGLFRTQLDNFVDYLDPKKRRADKETNFNFDFSEQKSEEEGFALKELQMFTRFRTAFQGVDLMICKAGIEKLADPGFTIKITKFRTTADSGRLAGLIVPADSFEGAPEDAGRLRI